MIPVPVQAGEIGDARVVFDHFRDRRVVLATAGRPSDSTGVALVASQRRTSFCWRCRATRPRDGFRTFGRMPRRRRGLRKTATIRLAGLAPHARKRGGLSSIGVSHTHYILTVGVGHGHSTGSAHTPLLPGWWCWMRLDVTRRIPDSERGLATRTWARRPPVGVGVPAVMNNDLPGLLGTDCGVSSQYGE